MHEYSVLEFTEKRRQTFRLICDAWYRNAALTTPTIEYKCHEHQDSVSTEGGPSEVQTHLQEKHAEIHNEKGFLACRHFYIIFFLTKEFALQHWLECQELRDV